jgi:site-specific recombinase XerD
MAAAIYDYFVNSDKLPSQSPSVVRRFLSFLSKNKVTKSNLSACVPSLRRPKPLPSVYTGDEISKLLETVDRSDANGKRDYAILMLASRLGLRSSDIVGLTENNIVCLSSKKCNKYKDKSAAPSLVSLDSKNSRLMSCQGWRL